MRLLRLDWLSGLFGRPILLYSLYTIVLFFVFLFVTFPHGILVRRALDLVKNPTVDVDFKDARFAWPGGYEVTGVKLTAVPEREGQPPFLEWGRLAVRPDYASLFKGNYMSAVLSGDLYGGEADLRGGAQSGSFVANLTFSDLQLNRYPALMQLLDEGQITGTVSGILSLVAPRDNPKAVQGEGEISLSKGSLSGGKAKGFKIPDLKISEAKATLKVGPDKIEVTEFTATGPDLALQGAGNILVRQPIDSSAVSLRLTVQKLPDDIKPLLAFLPGKRGGKANEGPATITVAGTFANPVIR